jgi:hypothetical protein
MTWLVAITQLVIALGVLANGVGQILNYRQSRKNGGKIEEVHLATNSLTDRLVETTRLEAHAAGVKEEKDRAE